MKSGILLIDKPAGMTSAGVVARVKRILKADKVGHAGTLDPDATGLLIILINGATRVASYAADGYKVYSGEMRLGVRTSTDDLAGNVLEQTDHIPPWTDVDGVIVQFEGRIQQVPPQVSAVKVNGKRAHKMHRSGETFELAPREVDIRRFERQPGATPDTFRYIVECSPGTYIRSLARDIGASLGCGGAVASIRRERSGHFSVDDALSLESMSWDAVQDWSALIPEVPRMALTQQVTASLLNGQPSGLGRAWDAWRDGGAESHNNLVVYYAEGNPQSLGILRIQDGDRFSFETNIHPKSS
jgi:tRNA pseudouridine55 synthase